MTTHLHTDFKVIPFSATDKMNIYFKSWLRRLEPDELRWLSVILESSLQKEKEEYIDTILVALRKVPMIVLSDSIQVSPMTSSNIREIMDHIMPVRTYEEAYEKGEMVNKENMGIKIKRGGDRNVFELCNLLEFGPSVWETPSIRIRHSSSDKDTPLRRVAAVLDLPSYLKEKTIALEN